MIISYTGSKMEIVSKKAARDGKIEVLRFLAAVIIMNGHAVSIGLYSERPFMYGWIYVEFFFMVTGFFTARLFAIKNKEQYPATVNIVSISLKYTLSKFLPFLAFSSVPMIITYVLRNLPLIEASGRLSFINSLTRLPAEILYFSEASKQGTLTGPLWFLSAMFIVTPFICMILNIKINKAGLFIAIWYCAFYYQLADFGLIAFPNTILRAFGGMFLGIIIFHFAEWIRGKELNNALRLIITAMEITTFILPLFISYMNYSIPRFQLICFILWIFAVQSGKSYIPKINSVFLNYLGRLSMPLYVWHYAVACIINFFFADHSMAVKLLLYWGLTFILSGTNLYIVSLIRSHLIKYKKAKAT